MSSKKRNNRSSKTDHVLSLLSGGAAGSPAPKEEMHAAQPAAAPSAASTAPAEPEKTVPEHQSHLQPEDHRLAPILQVEKHNSEALAHTIRDALAQSLESEMAQAEPAVTDGLAGEDAMETRPEADPAVDLPPVLAQEESDTQPAPEPQPQPQPEPTEPAILTPEPAVVALDPPAVDEPAAPEPASEPVPAAPPVEPAEPAPEPEPVSEPEPAEPVAASAPPLEPVVVVEAPEPPETEPETPFAPRETRLPDGAICLNIMELLVDERLERYVRMFGLCTCARCLADARALALTRLPAKYVVLDSSAATPMTSLYRAKYESMVVAQVIQACKIVMESPRHTL